MRRWIPGIAISIIAILAMTTGWVQYWELKSVDFRVGFLPGHPGPEVVIVAIDDRTIQDAGRWPLPRTYYARAIEKLKAAGAKTIAIDIIFATPDPAGDTELAAAIKAAGNVVLGQAPGFERITPAIDVVAGPNAGFLNNYPDADFEIRNVPMAIEDSGSTYPSFDVQALRLRPENRPRGWIGVNFRGGQNSFERISMADVVAGKSTFVFRDRIALIGVTAPAGGDMKLSPVGYIPGVEIHAHAIDTLIHGLAIREGFREVSSSWLLTAIMGIGGYWWLNRQRPTMILPWTGALLLLLIVGATLAYARLRMQLAMVSPAIALLASSLWTLQSRLHLRRL